MSTLPWKPHLMEWLSITTNINWASLSEPHTSVTALEEVVCMYVPSLFKQNGRELNNFKSCFRQIRFIKIPGIQFLPLDQIYRCNGSTISKRRTSHAWRSLYPRGYCFCSTKSPQKCISSKNFDRLSISPSASDYCRYLFCGLGEPQRLCRCFISVVLIRTLPDRLSRLIFATTSPFCLAKSATWFLLLRFFR